MYNYVLDLLGAPADPNNVVLWVAGLLTLLVFITMFWIITRLFK